MSDPFSDMLFENLKAHGDAQQAAIEQGVIIGRREMKPLIRELMNAIQDMDKAADEFLKHPKDWEYARALRLAVYEFRKRAERAKEALEND